MPQSDRQCIANTYGDAAAALYDRVVQTHNSLGRYLAAVWLETSLPRDVDLRRRQAMRIAALATQGETGDMLSSEVVAALEIGVLPEEIVEVMIHTIPYVGIPKALNSILATKQVLAERNLLPLSLQEPEWLDDERYDVGLHRINHAHPAAAPALADNLAPIAPSLYRYIVAAAFGDIYGRPGLDYPQRQPVTIVALMAQGGVRNHLVTHVNGALNIGMSPIAITSALIDTIPLVESERVMEGIDTALNVFTDRGVTIDTPAISW